MPAEFQFDVFLSHSAKDKAVVRELAARLQRDGVRVWLDEEQIKPGDSIPAKIEEGLEHSRVLVFCMSANAFGSDWAQLEAGTFRFRDPLNKERRFIPLRLDDAPSKGSLSQFLHINWFSNEREQAYPKLLAVCQQLEKPLSALSPNKNTINLKTTTQLQIRALEKVFAYSFRPDGKSVLTGDDQGGAKMWDVETGRCIQKLEGHDFAVGSVALGVDQFYALTGSWDGSVRLWDLKTGRKLQIMKVRANQIWRVAWSSDRRFALSCGGDKTMRLWNIKTGHCIRIFKGHSAAIQSVAWSGDQSRALSGDEYGYVRLWDVDTGRCLCELEGEPGRINTLALNTDGTRDVPGSADASIKLWDAESGHCLRVFEGHTGDILSLAWNADYSLVLSGSGDKTVRLWDVETGLCLCELAGHTTSVCSVEWAADQNRAFSGDYDGGIRVWNLSHIVAQVKNVGTLTTNFDTVVEKSLTNAHQQIQYTNAKVLVVGDPGSGKTGLTERLATGKWKSSGGSTVGAWSTQWQLRGGNAKTDIEREIWLWDFGGQADQRLIHQLYMDRAALIILLFNADKEDVLPGLRDWQTALRRCLKTETPQLLVAGRIDTGFKASRGKLQLFAKEHCLDYHETSARDGTGCDKLHASIISSIAWDKIPVTTTERLFKRIKDEILMLRDEGQVLFTFKELREELWRRLADETRFTDNTLKTVIGLLDGPGVVVELDYGTYILLAPEWINAYAQAVLRTLRSDESELGCLPLRSIAEGKLIYQSIGRDGSLVDMKRLPAAQERIVLGEMELQLKERGLCLQQGDKLVFPSHCGRDRPALVEHPSVFVSYAVKGYLDDIYATLVVKLSDSESSN